MIMKQMFDLLTKALLCAMLLFTASCGDDEGEGMAGDPTGTVLVSMRNDNQGSATSVYPDGCGYFYIDNADNFTGSSWSFVTLGKVKGLGSIKNIPENGWADKAAVQEGYGYVGRCATRDQYNVMSYKYIRIYVVEYMTSSVGGGVIGAKVKYAPLESNDDDVNGEVKEVELVSYNSMFSDWSLSLTRRNSSNEVYMFGPEVDIVDMGNVYNLGYITTVPSKGWTEQVQARTGYGYMVRKKNGKSYSYMRLYVNSLTVNSSDPLYFEATITYQCPFVPVEK